MSFDPPDWPADADEGYAPQEATCNRCGAEGLEWVDIGGHKARWRLYAGSRPHVCKQVNPATADDFEAIP